MYVHNYVCVYVCMSVYDYAHTAIMYVHCTCMYLLLCTVHVQCMYDYVHNYVCTVYVHV